VSTRTRVAIVGPGRVGTLLAVACARAGLAVVAVAGGSDEARARLRSLVAGVREHDDASSAARGADVVLLAVPDDAFRDVADALARDDAVRDGASVIHLSGVHGVDVLARVALTGAGVAACHPATTVPAGSIDPEALVGVAWAVTAPSAGREAAHAFVRALGGDPHDVADDRRVLYHAALTLASNAVGAAVVGARRLLTAAGVADVAAFVTPLAHASVTAAVAGGVEALTGPIVRGDVGTLEAHLDAIARDVPELLVAHVALAEATLATVRPALDAAVAERLEALLARSRTVRP